jgi:hydrogenase maturation protein HypF
MTSGNVSGAPICRSDEEAVTELGRFTDCILSHDRNIRIRADDSVMDFFEGKPYMIRRSRGYAPLPMLTSKGWQGQVLAVGGELKNTFCIGVNDLFYPSPYVGDLADVRTVDALTETVGRFETLLEAHPTVVACDLHPRYHSTVVAQELARQAGAAVVQVQHHYAHILSCMAENDYLEPVIGLSLDGTGYGTDGTVWGGEVLLAQVDGFARFASIQPFWQIGGDRSAQEGWRIAVALIYGLLGSGEEAVNAILTLHLCDAKTARIQLKMAEKRLNAISSTSAGRLFDGVSALLGVRRASTFEGEAATALQFAAEAYLRRGEEEPACTIPDFAGEQDGRLLLATNALVETILTRRLAGEDTGKLAYLFHKGLAGQMVAACLRARTATGRNTVALSGGCYQNTLLLRLTVEGLRAQGFAVLTHSLVPPNDGGIALGQAVFAMAAQQ